MIFALRAELAFSTAARRDAVLADIQAQIANRARWGVDDLRATALEFAGQPQPNGIYAELRFTTRADQESLRARIDAFATGTRAPLSGSTATLHDCDHDNPAAACAITVQRVW